MSSSETSDAADQHQSVPEQEIDPRNPAANPEEAARNAVACDYVDIVRLSGDQPRFLLQPHLSGGAVAMGAFTLEAEGARALAQHLKHALLE